MCICTVLSDNHKIEFLIIGNAIERLRRSPDCSHFGATPKSFVGTSSMTDSEREEYECGICHLDHHVADHPFVQCTNTLGDGRPHRFCNSMFRQYVQSECGIGGAYSGVRVQGNLRSESGHLPCPLFMAGECDCISMPDVNILSALAAVRQFPEESETVDRELRRFLLSRDRVTYDRMVEESHKEQERLRQARDGETSVDRLHRTVTEALSVGGGIRCPQCRVLVQKNDACIQMSCSQCCTSFCYCCGHREHTSKGIDSDDYTYCTTCGDHLFIEEQDGWGDFAINRENAATGALHEFHRRRMAYCIKQIKQETPPSLWERYQAAYPELLENVPTFGRRIGWNEIDEATPPLFGTTRAKDLAWTEEGHDILRDFRTKDDCDIEQKSLIVSSRSERIQSQSNQAQDESGDSIICFGAAVSSGLVFGCISSVTIVSICIVLLDTAENTYRTTAFIGISGFVAIATTILSERAVDAIAALRQQETVRAPWISSIMEVQFFGARHDELLNPVSNNSLVLENGQPLHQYSAPFLSRPHGRWRAVRRIYFATFSLVLALGSVSVTNSSSRRWLTVFGWFLILSTLLLYTAAFVVVNIEAPPMRTTHTLHPEKFVDEEGGLAQEARDALEREERFRSYLWVVTRIGCYTLLLAGGAAASIVKPQNMGPVVPLWLIGVAIGAVFAELLPRLARETEPGIFSQPVDCWTLSLSHAAFGAFSTGWSLLLIWYFTGSTDDLEWGSVAIVLFVLGLLGVYCCMEWFAYVHFESRFVSWRMSRSMTMYLLLWLLTLVAGFLFVSAQDYRVHGLGVATLVFFFMHLLTVLLMAAVERPPTSQEPQNGRDRGQQYRQNGRDRRRQYFRVEAQALSCVVLISAGSGLHAAASKGNYNYHSHLTTTAVVLVALGVCSLLALVPPFLVCGDGVYTSSSWYALSCPPPGRRKITSHLFWFALGLEVALIDRFSWRPPGIPESLAEGTVVTASFVLACQLLGGICIACI